MKGGVLMPADAISMMLDIQPAQLGRRASGPTNRNAIWSFLRLRGSGVDFAPVPPVLRSNFFHAARVASSTIPLTTRFVPALTLSAFWIHPTPLVRIRLPLRSPAAIWNCFWMIARLDLVSFGFQTGFALDLAYAPWSKIVALTLAGARSRPCRRRAGH